MHKRPAINRSSVIWRFEGSDAIEIRDRITFSFYTGLPHIKFNALRQKNWKWYNKFVNVHVAELWRWSLLLQSSLQELYTCCFHLYLCFCEHAKTLLLSTVAQGFTNQVDVSPSWGELGWVACQGIVYYGSSWLEIWAECLQDDLSPSTFSTF